VSDPLESLNTALGDRYAVEREIGRGGMATVYLAEDLRHHRQVAIKVLRPDLATTLGLERFLREIEIAAKLTHPNILALFDSGTAASPDGGPALLYYVMPYVDGESLRDRLNREGPLPIGDVLKITKEVADALNYAHSLGIVHRDIKPENILFTAGHALLADLGIARAVDAAGGERLTETGMAVGTPAYMSPEQAAGTQAADLRSDVYALGCVVYEMLAGEPPFSGPNAQAVLARHSVDPVPSLRTVRRALSEDVERVVRKALEKVPADRYRSATEFAEALASPAGTATVWAGRSRQALLVAVPLLAVLVVGWVLVARRAGPTDLRSVAVLPCDNLSRDPEQEYISDHYSEQIISKLSQVGSLNPKSWRAMRRYRGADKSSRKIASELGASSLVSCQVLEDEQGAVLAVQLIQADNDNVIWSDEYRTVPLADSINAIQSDAARQIAVALGKHPLAREQAALSQSPTHNQAALQLYRLGVHFSYQVRSDAVRRAIEYFEQAIDADSSFSLAYSWLADALTMLHEDNINPYRTRIADLVNRALELDSTNAHALTVKASWVDPDGWEAYYHDALRFAPNSPEVHLGYGFALASQRRYDEGLAELAKAEELDPTNPLTQGGLAQFFARARRYDEAEVAALRGLQFNPGNVGVTYALGFTYLARGDYSEGLALLEPLREQIPEELGIKAFVGYAYGKLGRQEDAEEVLAKLRELSLQQSVSGELFARVHAGLGNADSTYQYLVDYFKQEGDAACWWVTEGPLYDEYRSDRRLQRLLTQTGCPGA